MALQRVNLARMNLHIELAGTYGHRPSRPASTHRNVPPHHLTCSDAVANAYAAISPEAGATGVAVSWAISPWARARS